MTKCYSVHGAAQSSALYFHYIVKRDLGYILTLVCLTIFYSSASLLRIVISDKSFAGDDEALSG